MPVCCLVRYKTQQMCDEAVDDWQHLYLFLIGFIKVNCLNDPLSANDDMLFLLKIFVKSHFLVMKWELLV